MLRKVTGVVSATVAIVVVVFIPSASTSTAPRTTFAVRVRTTTLWLLIIISSPRGIVVPLTASPAGASASPAASPATLPTAPATSTGIGSVIAASLTTLSALTTLLLTTTARGVGVRPSGCGHKLGLQVGILRVAERGPRHGFHRRQRRHRARRFITIATIRRTTILNATTTTRLAPRGLIERRSRPSRPSRRLLPTRTRTHRRGVLVTTATTTTTTTTTHHRRIHHTSSIRMIPANVSSTILARPRARASGDNLGPRRHDVPPDAPRAQTHTYIYINTMSRPIALDTLHTHVTTAHVTIHSSQYDGKRDGKRDARQRRKRCKTL